MIPGLVIELGEMEYGAAWELQRRVVAAVKADAIAPVLLLCEHPHVITMGRNGSLANLRVSAARLRESNISFYETDRGGDITYHGPGQLVGYPILNLARLRRDVAWYMRSLEETLIRATAELGVRARRVAGRPGVWVDVREGGREDEEKLAAMGVHLSRWVSSHGFAYNVCTDLRYFDLIVPCGIAGKRATSLAKTLGRRVEIAGVASRVTAHLGELLGVEFRPTGGEKLEELLETHERQAAVSA